MNYQQERKARYLMLKGLHDWAAYGQSAGFEAWLVGEAVAVSAEEGEAAAVQLQRADLIERVPGGTAVRLTDEGLRTIERVLRQPLPATDTYPEVLDFDDHSRGARTVEQIDGFLTYLRRSLPKLKLDESARREISMRVDALEAQLNHPQPSRQLTLSGLTAIRDILQRAAEGDGIPVLARATYLLDVGPRA